MDNPYWVTFDDAAITKWEGCYTLVVPYYQKQCFTSYGQYLNDSCSISINNQTCNSCAHNGHFFDFDCSNVPGGAIGSTIPEFSPLLSECYAVISYTCTDLCGDGFYIPDSNNDVNVTVAKYGIYSCEYLTYLEESAYIPDYACPVYMEAAQNGCCKPLASIKPEPETLSPGQEDIDDDDDNDDAAPNLFVQSIEFMLSLATTTILL